MIIERDRSHVEHLGRDIWWVTVTVADIAEPKDLLMEVGSLKAIATEAGSLRTENIFNPPLRIRTVYYTPGDIANPSGVMSVNFEMTLCNLSMKPEFLEELGRTHVDIPIDLANI